MTKLLDTILMLALLATVIYALYGLYNMIPAWECLKVTPPDGWQAICGVE